MKSTAHTPAQQNIASDSVAALARQCGAEIVYSQEERNAVLGRHTVQQSNVPNSELALVSVIAGAVTASTTKSITGCSWKVAATTGVIGAAVLCVMGKVASARQADISAHQIVALQNAEHKLAQIKASKASLMATKMDSPDYQCNGDEKSILMSLDSMYNEPSRILGLLWARAYAPEFRDDSIAFNTKFTQMLCDEFHMGPINPKSTGEIMLILMTISRLLVSAQAKMNPAFKDLVEHRGVPPELHDELAEFMFWASKLILDQTITIGDETIVVPYPAKTCYLDYCQQRYSHYMNLLEQDEVNLENDVRILRSMHQQDLPES